MDDAYLKVKDRLASQCARREYCSSDILSKAVKALDGDRAAAETLVADLVRDKFVDDYRYSCAFAREKSSLGGWGPVKIRMALAAKGIASQTIKDALQEVDPDKASIKLENVLRAKWKTLCGDPQAKLKLLKFALGRGYEYDAVRGLVDDICSGQED